jgi:rod shape-determining protein MreD
VSSRENFLAIVITALLGLMLTVVPLPHWLAIVRPSFLVLVVLYWSTMAPFAGGIALGFFGGLCLDVFDGSLLGEHALALAFVTYLAVRLHLLMRAKPLFEQSLFVVAGLVIYESLLWGIDGWSGHALSSWARWVQALTGGLLWPLAVGLLGRFHTPQ